MENELFSYGIYNLPIMISDEQIQFYQKQLKNGLPDGELRELMKKDGFTQEDIKAVFKPHHYDMRSWYLVFGILISLFGLYNYIQTGGLLILILGVLLLGAYYYEVKRLERFRNLK